MVSKARVVRISERIRDELSNLLVKEVQDPRLNGVSITDVTVDRELAFADIYVSSYQGSTHSADTLAGLERAQGFLRSELAHRIDLRHFPRLRFHWDPTFDRAEVIEQLIKTIQDEKNDA